MCKYGTLAALRIAIAVLRISGGHSGVNNCGLTVLLAGKRSSSKEAGNLFQRKVQLVICQISRFSRQFADATRRLQNLNIGMLYYSKKKECALARCVTKIMFSLL